MLWFYLLQVLLFALRWPNSIRLGRLTLDFTSFQPPGQGSHGFHRTGLMSFGTSVCRVALVVEFFRAFGG